MHYYAVFDFARLKKNLSDFSALLDAPKYSSVDLEIEWGDISDIYTTKNTATIDASTNCEISLVEAYDDPNISREGIPNLADIRDSLIDIRLGVEQHEIDAKHESYNDDIQQILIQPTPSVILNHMIFAKKNVTDGNASFADDVITQLKLENTEGSGLHVLHGKWKDLQAPMKTDYSLASLPTGIVYIDWRDQRQGGLLNQDVEALKLRILTNAPAANKKNAIRILREYIPR